MSARVDLPSGHVMATVTGPKVPPFVSPAPPQVTATVDISLADVSGVIPIRLSDVPITDQLGRTLHPRPIAARHRRPPLPLPDTA